MSDEQQHIDDEDLIDLVSIDEEIAPQPAPPWYHPAALRSVAVRNRWYIAFVAMPTFLAAIYFLLIAADRYETEARFVVKRPNTATGLEISGVFGDAGVMRSSEDAYIVHAYMASRDAVRRLIETVDLKAKLSRPEADFIWRYPRLFSGSSEERLWKHFQSFTTIKFNSNTGISTLAVQAFRPEDAREIALALIKDSEALLNRVGKRLQGEALRSAQQEVEVSRQRAKEALEAVTVFRRRTALVDPVRYSQAALEIITTLAVEVARSKSELAELELSSPTSPQALSIRRRIDALEAQMTKERLTLAGSDSSLAPLIAEYERLTLDREFAERTFASALASMEVARIDAGRQQLFLDLVSTPALSDYPNYPWRIVNIMLTFAAFWVVFSIGRHMVGDTLSHAGN